MIAAVATLLLFIDSVKRMQALALLVLIAVALILLAAALLNG